MAMTSRELSDWLDLLCDDQGRRCNNIGDRIEVLKGLLNHASEDQMSAEDRETCVQALDRLSKQIRLH